MSNSGLANYRDILPYKWTGRNGNKISKIFVHHMAGNLSVKSCARALRNNHVSAHYGVSGKNIGLYVDEKDTAWHCGNRTYNYKSIGIECANDGGASKNWHVSNQTVSTLVELLVDICERNGISKLKYTGDLNGNLCLHKWVASTACPGPYMTSIMKDIAKRVNKKMPSGIVLPARGYFKKGDKGAGVGVLQAWLDKHGYEPGKVDKIYGPKTEAAVKLFQHKKKLTIDGKFGIKSLKAANRMR